MPDTLVLVARHTRHGRPDPPRSRILGPATQDTGARCVPCIFRILRQVRRRHDKLPGTDCHAACRMPHAHAVRTRILLWSDARCAPASTLANRLNSARARLRCCDVWLCLCLCLAERGLPEVCRELPRALRAGLGAEPREATAWHGHGGGFAALHRRDPGPCPRAPAARLAHT